MSVLAPAATAPMGSAASIARRPLRESAELPVALFALAVLLVPVTAGAGGRDPHLRAWALAALLPSVLVIGPRRLSSWFTVLALAPCVAAVIVCLTAPTGWAGAGAVATLGYAGVLASVLRAAGSSTSRRLAFLAALCVGGLYQFREAFLPWWGHEDVAHAMSGSFFAANVFGGYMAGVGLAACALAATAENRLRWIGVVAGPFCLAAVVYSASRAALGLAVLAAAGLALLLVVQRAWRPLMHHLLVLAGAAALTAVLASPLIVPGGGSPLAAAGAKNANAAQTLDSSGGVRLDWWAASVAVGREHPLTGAGFGTFGAAGSRYEAADGERSSFVHNVVLQAWSDGGIVLLAPVVLALLAFMLACFTRLRIREPAVLAGLFGGGLLLAHAMVDFDFEYPSSIGVFAALAGLLVAVPRASRPNPRRIMPAPGWWSGALVLGACVLALLAALRFDVADRLVRRGQVTGGMLSGASGPLRDARFDVLRLQLGQHDKALLSRTERLQYDSAAITWLRASALVDAGQAAQARELADRSWHERRARQPGQAIGYARVLADTGDDVQAMRVLVEAFHAALQRPASGDEASKVLTALVQMGRADVAACLQVSLPHSGRAVTGPPTSACAAAMHGASS